LIYIQLTNGFGNNLFQYNAARLLAGHHETGVTAIPPEKNYYGISSLKKFGLSFCDSAPSDCVTANGNEEFLEMINKKYKDNDILLTGYFEDYRFFINYRERIKSWYPPVKTKNSKDLVVHLRTGDRLFVKNEFYSKPNASDYVNAINNFDFEKLHIVTDMPVWKKINSKELSNMKFHTTVSKEISVPIGESVEYFNSFVEQFAQFDPIIQKRNVDEDFNFIRTFDNILFEHGTLSWWAAFLSDAKKVGVYGPWRPWKGESNKNLSNIPLPGWFKWYRIGLDGNKGL
jgi:hypothetical protein